MRIHKIFGHFVIWYDDAWSSKVSDSKTYALKVNEWAKILAGLNAEQLNRAMKRCPIEFKTFPPTPGEFRDLCFPSLEEIGAPSRDEAYYLAAKKDLRNPFVQAAYEKIGNWRFSHSLEYEIKKDFFEIYDALLQRTRETGEIPAVTKLLENNSTHSPVPEDYFSPQALVARGAKVIDMLKQTHFPNVKWNMDVAKELAEIFSLRKKTAAAEYPELDQIGIISLVEKVAEQELREKMASINQK